MATIRIETVADAATGQVFAEVYRDEFPEPIMKSAAAFTSDDDLVKQVVEMLRTHFPDHFPFVEDPTIGV